MKNKQSNLLIYVVLLCLVGVSSFLSHFGFLSGSGSVMLYEWPVLGVFALCVSGLSYLFEVNA